MTMLLAMGLNLSSVHYAYVVVLQSLIYLAVALSVLVAADRIIHVIQYIYWRNCDKLRGTRPEDRYNFADLPEIVSTSSVLLFSSKETPTSLLLTHTHTPC
jgi:hypothetical protein